MIWLKANNRYYTHIEINQENLESLPNDGNIFSNAVNNQNAQINIDSHPELPINQDLNSPIMRSGLADLTTIDQRLLIQDILGFELSEHGLPAGILPWPEIGQSPINEFNTQGYIACAFPVLFPFGNADLRTPRLAKVDPNLYFKHLMKYKDGRFAKHNTFRFFAMNSILRWMAFSNATVCIKKIPELQNLQTADAILQYIQTNPNGLKQIIAFKKNLRSTRPYWYQRSRELLTMIETIGTPTLFITLSAADLHWNKLHLLLDPDHTIQESSSRTVQQKSQMISDNPIVACYFFKHRLEAFLKQVFFPKFDVIDHWHRIEFQHRGSPHMHGVFWLKNAPKVDLQSVSHAIKETIRTFFDASSALISQIRLASMETFILAQ